jgi:hypothetical protein
VTNPFHIACNDVKGVISEQACLAPHTSQVGPISEHGKTTANVVTNPFHIGYNDRKGLFQGY